MFTSDQLDNVECTGILIRQVIPEHIRLCYAIGGMIYIEAFLIGQGKECVFGIHDRIDLRTVHGDLGAVVVRVMAVHGVLIGVIAVFIAELSGVILDWRRTGRHGKVIL